MATQPSANFVRRPTGLGEATTNTSSDKGPINGTDSGYGSLDSTPDGKSCEDGKFELKHRFSRQLFRRFKKTKLRPFDQEISQAVQNRFSDLTELFGSSLYSFLIKRRVKYNAISIKLKVLGKDERSAKPWVVVQCDEAASKPIKDFFDQPAVKSQYRPGGSEPDLPSFDVVVHPRAPVSLAAPHQVSVYDNSLTDFDTLCGKIIRIGSLDKPHIATLGGLIMIEKSWGEFMLKGLTAGHILTQESITGHNNGRESPSTYIYTGHSSCETGPIQLKPGNQKDEDGLMHNGDHPQEQEYSADGEMAPEFELDEEDIEIDLAVKIGKATKGTTSFQDSSLDITTQDNQLEEYWSKIGSIYSTSRDKESGPDQDWALVNIDPYLYRPNLLADKPSGANMPELTKLSGELDNSEGSRAVILLSGIGGPKRGMLSLSPSFLMMGHAKSFTKTYNLLLHHDPAPSIGNSGSWVVDEQSYGVYGHLVASDALGEAYVVPFNQILLDIKYSLGAVSTRLPGRSDISDCQFGDYGDGEPSAPSNCSAHNLDSGYASQGSSPRHHDPSPPSLGIRFLSRPLTVSRPASFSVSFSDFELPGFLDLEQTVLRRTSGSIELEQPIPERSSGLRHRLKSLFHKVYKPKAESKS